jgi:hypothetical protein
VEQTSPGLVAWWENRPEGLEQGWTLDAPPSGDGDVVVRLGFDGVDSIEVDEDGRGALLLADIGVRYDRLAAFDATGRVLPARMSARGTELSIRVSDAGAAYPITIDPLLSTPSWAVEPNQTGALLGSAVASAGDVNGDGFGDVVVGANLFDGGLPDEGAAFVYLGSATGLSTTAAWTAEGQQAYAWFGVSVAGAGDVNGDGWSDVVVGAQQASNPQIEEGRAFVFHGSPTGLGAVADWSGESDQAGAFFGKAVGGAGDVDGDGYGDLLVGSIRWDGGLFNEGASFLYLGSATGLATTAVWSVESNQFRGEMGWSVTGAGDVDGDGFADVLVGIYLYEGGELDEGAAHLYLGSPTGPGSTPDWSAEGNVVGATMGSSVAAAGDVNGDGYADILVGAAEWTGPESREGQANLYYGSPTGPSLTADWTGEGDQEAALYGWSVASAGDVNGDGFADIVVGASGFTTTTGGIGKAFLHLGSASGPEATPSWSYELPQESGFGWSVSSAGDVDGDGRSEVVVGAQFYDGVEVDEGAAFLFAGAASEPGTSSNWTLGGGQAAAALAPVATGDVNGDGFSDLVVGAPGFDGSSTDAGAVYLLPGSPTGPGTATWTQLGAQAGEALGTHVAVVDVDGDGYADVVAGAPEYDGAAGLDAGRVRVHAGSAVGVAAAASFLLEGVAAGDGFGVVSDAGDVNGDGFGDVLIGAPNAEGSVSVEADEGVVSLHLGSATGLTALAAWSFESDSANAGAGTAVAGLGDVNGDGYDDFAVGAPGFAADAGRVWVFPGGAGGPGAAIWTGNGAIAGAEFGAALARAGDVDGDGFADLAVGAPGDGTSAEGSVSIFFGSTMGPSGTASFVETGGRASAALGSALASADVNGDAFGDLVLGAPGWDVGGPGQGQARLLLGSSTGPLSGTWTVLGGAGDGLGTRLAGGDLDGDGYGDLVVCSPGAGDANNPPVDAGSCALHLGNTGDGAGASVSSPAARARLPGSSFPLAVGGRSTSDTSFDVALLARSPFGRTQVKAQVEVKPVGTPFDGLSLQTSAGWTNTALLGANLTVTASGLIPETPHHWRARVLLKPTGASPMLTSHWLYGGRSGDAEGTHVLAGCLNDNDADGQCDSVDLDDDNDGDPDTTDCADNDPTVFTGAPELCNAVDDDCDTVVDDGLDGDGDGVTTCGPDGTVGTVDDDCDDLVATTFPGAVEACNAVDDDCDLGVDEGFDGDGDGVTTCGPDGLPGATADNDCDDAVATTFPGAPELCNGVDDDCDGSTDDGLDGDGDGFTPCGPDGSPFTAADNDCDDAVATTFPGAPELCNAVDDDCDGVVDDGFDGDGDSVTTCGPDGLAGTPDDDCADAIASVNPGAAELCDGWDTDCAGGLGDATSGEADELDADLDGFFACLSAPVFNPAFGYGDCDDASAAAYPGASEIADDGVDQDCNGADTVACWVDADEDGWGVPTPVLDGDGDCTDDLGQSAVSTDCDDTDPTIYPTAPEACDAVDSDCDTPLDLVDEFDDTDGDGEPDCIDEDDDDDGFVDDEDCGPLDEAVYPGAVEVCDSVDSDCDDDLVDDFDDTDGDGVPDCVESDADDDGDPAATDCDDTDATVYSGAPEVPDDGIDQDCDGFDAAACALDEDGDGYGSGPTYIEPTGDCAEQGGAALTGDCDDQNRRIHPNAVEVCDGQDTDCDPNTTAEGGEVDDDGDGWLGCEGDCDDEDEDVSPEAEEDCNLDGDQDCDGLEDVDDCRGRQPFESLDQGCAGCGASVVSGAGSAGLAFFLLGLGSLRRRRSLTPRG